MKLPNQHVERFASLHQWHVTESKPFKTKHHINLLELEVFHREYSDLVSKVQGGLRCINLTDSRVVLGAVAKGRSSSRNVNRLLRKCLALSLAGQKSVDFHACEPLRLPFSFQARAQARASNVV